MKGDGRTLEYVERHGFTPPRTLIGMTWRSVLVAREMREKTAIESRRR